MEVDDELETRPPKLRGPTNNWPSETIKSAYSNIAQQEPLKHQYVPRWRSRPDAQQ